MLKKLLVLFLFLFLIGNVFATGNDWWNSNWRYKQELELNTQGLLTNDITNDHAILVYVDSSNTDFWENTKTNGEDVRFTNSDNSIDLNYHFEDFNSTNQEMWAWVRIPEFDADANTIINMYYRNPNAVDNQNVEGTYPDYYLANWGLTTLDDFTSNNCDLTNYGSATSGVDGKIAKAYEFNGIDQYLQCESFGNVTNKTGTILAWIKPNNAAKSETILSSANNITVYFRFAKLATSSRYNAFVTRDESDQTINTWGDDRLLSTSEFNHVVVKIDDSVSSAEEKVNFFINGDYQDNTYYNSPNQPGLNFNNFSTTCIGTRADTSGSHFDGVIDNLKVLDYILSDEEVSLLYNSESQTLLNFGPLEIGGIGVIANFDTNRLNTTQYLWDNSITNEVTIDSWSWEVDSIEIATTQNTSFTVTSNTDHNVCLTVTDSTDTYTDSTCQTISVGDIIAPTTSFSYEQISGTTNLNIILTCTDNNSGCQYINFRINDGDWNHYSVGDNPLTIIYSGIGKHNIQYYSTDNADNNEAINTNYFTNYDSANMTSRFYAFITTIAIILGACYLFIYKQSAGKGLTGIILIITGIFTQTSESIVVGTAEIFGYAGYILITIGIWLIIKEITNR